MKLPRGTQCSHKVVVYVAMHTQKEKCSQVKRLWGHGFSFFFILLFVSNPFAGRVPSRLILGKDKGKIFLEE